MTSIEAPLTLTAKILALGSAIVSPSPSAPVLSNVRLSVSKGEAAFTFTDLQMWLSTSLPVDADAITVTTLPAGLLARAVGAMEGSSLKLEVNAERAIARGGRARFNLPLLAADKFPMPPATVAGEPMILSASACARALSAVSYCAGDNILHPQSVRFIVADGEVAVASFDGNRLGLDRLQHTGEGVDSFSITTKAAKALVSICAAAPEHDLRISLGDRFAEFQCAAWSLRAQLADDKFPSYAKVIDAFEDGCTAFQCVAKDLDRALGRLQLLADKHSEAVKFDLTADKLSLSLVNQKIGDASEELPIASDGEPLTAGFRLSFVRDALRGIAGDQVEFCIDGEKRGLLRPLDRAASTSVHFFGPYKL